MPAEHGSRGATAEAAALDHLLHAGLQLVEANVRAGHGELDLVMLDARCADRPTLVFVEVRHRDHGAFGGALASVDARKQAKLIRAAEGYLALHPQHARLPCRFDVVGSSGTAPHLQLDWQQDAFRAG